MTLTFRDTLAKISPRWLRGPLGERVLYAGALHLDILAEYALRGLLCGYPGAYPDGQALSRSGRERGLPRMASEPDANYAYRQIRWIDTLQTDGTMTTLLEQVQCAWTDWTGSAVTAQAQVDAVEHTGRHWILPPGGPASVTTESPWYWDGHSALAHQPYWGSGTGHRWGEYDGRTWGGAAADTPYPSRYWLVIYPDTGQLPVASTEQWGGIRWGSGTGRQWGDDDGRTWGAAASLGRWGTAGADRLWGGRGTRARVEATLAAVARWSPPHACCWHVLVVVSPAQWATTRPSGDWSRWRNRTRSVLYWAVPRSSDHA